MEHDRQRRRLDKEKERKVERDRRDYEREDKDGEHDSRELEGPRKRKPFPRKMEDTAGAETHQGVPSENHGIHSVSASSYDDKDALKSKSFGILRQLFMLCMIYVLLHIRVLRQSSSISCLNYQGTSHFHCYDIRSKAVPLEYHP